MRFVRAILCSRWSRGPLQRRMTRSAPTDHGAESRLPPRPLRRDHPPRRGRHGPGLAGHRHAAGPPGRAEDPPRRLAADPDRLARFKREAQILASLNHPNIAAIYGIEEAEGTRALVLELVEGPTLADRISNGPIPLDEALPIAKQIAEALEAAHEAGVIHRDLKPANIKVREDGTVKVLDFGLAKALDPNPEADPSQSPTLTAAATQMGVIMGTAAYMSPEQARGKTVDRRADIWSFGAVLFEMLTGARAFTGADVSLTLAKVLEREPLWDLLPDTTSPSLRNLLERCLEKEPRQRVQAVGDVRLAMEGAFETSVNPLSVHAGAAQLQLWQRPIPAALAALAIAATASLTVWALIGPAAISADLMRFVIAPPESAPLAFSGFGRDVVISGDGTLIAYNGTSPGGAIAQINLRPIDQVDGATLRGTVQGIAPFFSPDGEWVGFYNIEADALQKVSIFGGPAVTLTQTPMVLGASWGADDQIIFGTTSGANGGSGPGLFRLSGEGGQPEALTTLDVEQAETSHSGPFIIPDRGRRALRDWSWHSASYRAARGAGPCHAHRQSAGCCRCQPPIHLHGTLGLRRRRWLSAGGTVRP